MTESKKIYVSETGLKDLQNEYDNLVHVVRVVFYFKLAGQQVYSAKK